MFRGTKIASLYKAYRPVYPPALVERVLHFIRTKNAAPKYDLALDVGCGSGQLTSLLSPHFLTVIGIDESQAQIDEAVSQNRNKNVTFNKDDAVNLDLASKTVDLITAAQCIHWLDTERFYQEAERVLKPKGTLAIVTYRNAILECSDQEMSREMTRIHDEIFAFFRDHKYMNARAAISKYKGHELEVPFADFEKDSSIFMEQPSTINDYVGFVSSTSYYAKFLEANPGRTDFLDNLRERLLKVSGQADNMNILLKYPMDLTLACMK